MLIYTNLSLSELSEFLMLRCNRRVCFVTLVPVSCPVLGLEYLQLLLILVLRKLLIEYR